MADDKLDGETVRIEGFTVRIWFEDDVFIADVVELPGCVEQAETRQQVVENITKAMFAYLRVVARAAATKREQDKVVPIGAARKKAKK